jgi:hypothetical protein
MHAWRGGLHVCDVTMCVGSLPNLGKRESQALRKDRGVPRVFGHI